MKPQVQEETYQLTISYDGARYHGWQKQPSAASVQETLEKALHRVTRKKISVVSAGRTDAGVHALGQRAHIKSTIPFTPIQLRYSLNSVLPKDIVVRSVRRVVSHFHARYSASRKTYRYQIHHHIVRSPLKRAVSWHIPRKLDLKQMRRAAKILKGRHDFRSFQRASSRYPYSTVRTIHQLKITKRGSLIQLTVTGNGFLYQMVRCIVGLLVEVGLGRISIVQVRDILKQQDRRLAPKSAPAHGLLLVRVQYRLPYLKIQERKRDRQDS
jgi:tRNA pseudouridine38-40 synthase